jgi:hypothetical protein
LVLYFPRIISNVASFSNSFKWQRVKSLLSGVSCGTVSKRWRHRGREEAETVLRWIYGNNGMGIGERFCLSNVQGLSRDFQLFIFSCDGLSATKVLNKKEQV